MHKRGFTLVELVIVIAVIAILSSVLIPTFSDIINKANDSNARLSATNLMKEYTINNPNAKSFIDNGTKYYVAYFTIVRGGKTYIFRYSMNGEMELIDSSEIPTFSGFELKEVYDIDYTDNLDEDYLIKLYRKKLSNGKYLYYQVSPKDSYGNYSITAIFNDNTEYFVLTGDYYCPTRLDKIDFSNNVDAGDDESEQITTITDAIGLVYQSDNNGKASIVGYQGTDTVVVIPDTSPNGDLVSSIGSSSFRNCNITSITMGRNIIEIGSNAFLNCVKLKTVVLNDGIKELKGASFFYCFNLTDINLPSSLTKIYETAFKKCPNLESITIPDGCQIMGGAIGQNTDILFANGTNSMTDGNVIYRFIDGALTSEPIEGSNGKTLLSLKSDCQIPSDQDIICIGYKCFSYDYVTSIYIPDSVTTISSFAFYANNGLKEITGGNNVVTIGDHAFRSCLNFENIILSDAVQSLGLMSFSGCSKLTISLCNSLSFNESALSGVKSIVLRNEGIYSMIDGCMLDDNGVVCQCQYDSSIPTDSNIKVLGNYCFVSCGLSGDIIVPDNITELGKNCFSECSKIKTVYVGKNVKTMKTECFSSDYNLTTAVLECEIEVLPYWTFLNCYALTDVTLSKTIKKINNYAFYGCKSLKTIHFGGTMAEWRSIEFDISYQYQMPEFSVECSDGVLKWKK